jgi:hypothetical protein
VPDLPGDLDERVQELRDEVGPLLDRAGGDAAAAAEALVRRVVSAVVASDAFETLWSTAQRAGHSEVVSVLARPEPLQVGEQVVVPLDPFVDAVSDQLAGLGLELDAALDNLTLALPLASAGDFEAARVAYRLLERLWLLIPAAAVALALVSVGLARRRFRALAILGGLAAVLCLGLLAAMGVGRGLLLDADTSRSARLLADRILDAVSSDLRQAAVVGVLVGAAVLVAAAVLGLVARAVRRTTAG